MGRFYFHLQADDQIVPDDEGVELPDLSAAEHEAILAARELVAEAIKSGRPEVPEAFVIADEEGARRRTVYDGFAEAPEEVGGLRRLHRILFSRRCARRFRHAVALVCQFRRQYPGVPQSPRGMVPQSSRCCTRISHKSIS